MPDIKHVNRSGGNEIDALTNSKVPERDVPRVSQSNVRANQTDLPVGRPAETRQPVDTSSMPPAQKILSDAATGRDVSQLEAAKQLSALGGVSATDRLLGLDLRPTMTGVLVAPPGNSEFLRHVSPQMRRTSMRKMLSKQRTRMRRLALFVRNRRDGSADDEDGEQAYESFIDVLDQTDQQERMEILRATSELDRTSRMLDILDEMLAMQDYTISQIGSFSQG